MKRFCQSVFMTLAASFVCSFALGFLPRSKNGKLSIISQSTAKKNLKSIIGIIAILMLLPAVAAQISVSPIEVDLINTESYTDLTIANVGNDKAYVSLTPMRLDNPGTPQSHYETLHNNPRQFGLVVSPLKIVIPPQLSRKVRIMSLVQNNPQDVMYMIRVVPSEGEMQAVADRSGDVLAGIQVISGYNVLVTVRPAMPQPKLSLTRIGTQLTVVNTGNTQVLLSDAEQCDAPPQCTKLNLPKRMYAGNTWQVTLPKPEAVQFLQTYFQNQYTIVKSN